ncbi:MAG: glycosyltransferase family 4 protein [Rhodospirillales bacterium]|nr:glycosyltransferase family 4 protein [Rhodospirillales bacterium]
MAIRICFIEDSVEFDGYSPTSRPLDAPQKALAYLSASLALRGHTVSVVNNATLSMTCDGVAWPGRSGEVPGECDLAVAVGDARLHDRIATAGRRLLWVPGDPDAIAAGPRAAAIARHRPEIVFHSHAQRDRWMNPDALTVHVIAPAIAPAYFEDISCVPSIPPRAIAVCHPLAGLERIVRLWADHVQPLAPGAELHVHSARLERAIRTGEVPSDLVAIHDLVRTAMGVLVFHPLADPQLADAYRAARVFLHPGRHDEAIALNLMEAQAAGLPAVVFGEGPLARERVVDGHTGSIRYGEEAYAEAVATLLNDEAAWRAMSDKAREIQRGRSWAIAAAEWEEKFA